MAEVYIAGMTCWMVAAAVKGAKKGGLKGAYA